MKIRFAIFASLLWLGGCASTATNEINFKDEIRPIVHEEDTSLDIALELQKAQADYEAEHYDKSYDTYQLVALKNPKNLAARIGWGDASIALNLFEKAYEIFSANFEFSNEDETLKHKHLAGLVLSEVATGRVDDEEVRLNEALEYNLNDPRLWNALGLYHDKEENWVQAQRTYLKAMTTEEKYHSSVINNLGMSYLKQGLYDQALEKFEQAISVKSDRTLYDNNRRLTLALMGDHEAAVDNIVSDRAANIFNDAGYIALTQKKFDVADTLLNQAVSTSTSFHADAEENLERLKAQLMAHSITTDIKHGADLDGQDETNIDWGELLP